MFSDRRAAETRATIHHGDAIAALRRFYAMPAWENDASWGMTEGHLP